MIVLGADTHKRSHTIAAVSAATGEVVGEQTVQVGAKGFVVLLVWARGLEGERVWAIEDCRHVSRDELRRIGELSRTIKALEPEIASLVATVAPQLICEPGFGPLTAAKLVGEVAGAGRFASDAKLARAAGVAPIPVSSGKTQRHRLDRGGNRQINATLHRIAVTRLRCHPETQDYIARKRAEGKSTKDAIRCLKRHLARRVWHLLQPPHPESGHPHPSTS